MRPNVGRWLRRFLFAGMATAAAAVGIVTAIAHFPHGLVNWSTGWAYESEKIRIDAALSTVLDDSYISILRYQGPWDHADLRIGKGRMAFSWQAATATKETYDWDLKAVGFRVRRAVEKPKLRCGMGLGSLSLEEQERRRTNRYVIALACPAWFPFVALTTYPAFAIWSYLRTRRRRRLGLCVKCGYDLRATPDRCPECGTEVHGQSGTA
ncbi:MAG: hypothetical protein J5J06_07200 [Phycisphaerae bacterium]|nr:hypothetical protein [Phycisphaerae bacterium]